MKIKLTQLYNKNIWSLVMLLLVLSVFSQRSYAQEQIRVTGYTGGNSDINGIYTRSNLIFENDANASYTIQQTETNGAFYWRIYSNTEIISFATTSSEENTITDDISWDNESDNTEGYPIVNLIPSDGAPEIVLSANSYQIINGSSDTQFTDLTRFPSTLFGGTPSQRTFTILNGGDTDALTITSTTCSGTNAAAFSVTSDPSSSIGPGSTTSFTIEFEPTALGHQEAIVEIVNNDSDESLYTFAVAGWSYEVQNLTVSGMETTAANGTYTHQGILNEMEFWKHSTETYYLYCHPATSPFGNGEVNNWGVDVDQIFDNGNYLIYCESKQFSPVGVAPDPSFALPYWFTVGEFKFTGPTITSINACMSLKGNNIKISNGDDAPNIIDNTDFGTISNSTTKDVVFSIENIGASDLTISDISLTGNAEFLIIDPSSFPLTVSGNDSESLNIQFTGSASEGDFSSTVTLTCNDAYNQTYSFDIKATVAETKEFLGIENQSNGVNWSEPSNWSPNGVPSSLSNVIISAECFLDVSPTVHQLTISSEGSLTVPLEQTLTVEYDIIIQSDASNTGSLIDIGGITTANPTTVQRYMTGGDKWHLISSPVTGLSIWDYATSVDNSIATNEGQYAITGFDVAENSYKAFPTTNPAELFIAGEGYSTLRSTDGSVSFEGTLNSGAFFPTIVDDGNKWNLIGNPYPSAIIGSFNNEITPLSGDYFLNVANISKLDPNFAAIYIWDSSSSMYTTITNGSNSSIQACQGFFVKSKDGGGELILTAYMQSAQPAITLKSATKAWSSVLIKAEQGNSYSTTKLQFNEEMTLGLDVSYDAGKFSVPGLNLCTRLVEDNGVDFDVQALPSDTEDDILVPMAYKWNDFETEVVFSAEFENMDQKKVYLYDAKETNYTDLSVEDYTAVVDETDEADRFSLLVKNKETTPAMKFDNEDIQIYTNQQTIVVLNPAFAEGRMKLFNQSGRLVNTQELNKQERQIWDVKAAKGIYIVQIIAEGEVINKKILIQ